MSHNIHICEYVQEEYPLYTPSPFEHVSHRGVLLYIVYIGIVWETNVKS